MENSAPGHIGAKLIIAVAGEGGVILQIQLTEPGEAVKAHGGRIVNAGGGQVQRFQIGGLTND